MLLSACPQFYRWGDAQMSVSPDKSGAYVISARVDKDTYDRLRILAFEEDLTVNSFVAYLIRLYLDKS